MEKFDFDTHETPFARPLDVKGLSADHRSESGSIPFPPPANNGGIERPDREANTTDRGWNASHKKAAWPIYSPAQAFTPGAEKTPLAPMFPGKGPSKG